MQGYIYPNEFELQWSLLIVLYPYLTGLVAGAFILASLERVFNVKEIEPTYRLSLLTALAFLLVAPLPLLAHLGHPERSYEIFLTPKQTAKCCARIVTDSTPLEEPKNPEACNVFSLLKLFANEQELAEIAEKYRAGGYGYGQAKGRLAELINERFAEARDRYAALMADPDTVHDILRDGGQKARRTAEATMQRVRDACAVLSLSAVKIPPKWSQRTPFF